MLPPGGGKTRTIRALSAVAQAETALLAVMHKPVTAMHALPAVTGPTARSALLLVATRTAPPVTAPNGQLLVAEQTAHKEIALHGLHMAAVMSAHETTGPVVTAQSGHRLEIGMIGQEVIVLSGLASATATTDLNGHHLVVVMTALVETAHNGHRLVAAMSGLEVIVRNLIVRNVPLLEAVMTGRNLIAHNGLPLVAGRIVRVVTARNGQPLGAVMTDHRAIARLVHLLVTVMSALVVTARRATVFRGPALTTATSAHALITVMSAHALITVMSGRVATAMRNGLLPTSAMTGRAACLKAASSARAETMIAAQVRTPVHREVMTGPSAAASLAKTV